MTPISGRALKRLSAALVYSQGRARPVVVHLGPAGDVIGFRLAGTRRVYWWPIAVGYREAVRAELARVKAERKKARKEACSRNAR